MTSGGTGSRGERATAFSRLYGAMPWLRPTPVKKRFRVKVFKSGNSLALRLPSGLDLKAGMEMNLEVEDGDLFTFEPVDRPKRAFNIAKVAGSATSLKPIADEDRVFEERPLIWPEPDERP
jgi:antitoxin VapB